MIKKIFFQSIFFNFFFLREVFAAESGGMPQLNPEFWVSQIFWLIITFGILFTIYATMPFFLKGYYQKCSKTEVHFSSKTTKKGRIHQQDKPTHTNASKQLVTSHLPTPLVALSPHYSVTRRSSVPSLQILDPFVVPSYHNILDTQIRLVFVMR